MNTNNLELKLGFGGGAEHLTNNVKSKSISLDGSQKWNIKKLLIWIKDNIITEREDLFLQNETVRPGILVLVNDTDWELLGELEYELQQNDEVVFISTLHGG